jgi:hypothetical protein
MRLPFLRRAVTSDARLTKSDQSFKTPEYEYRPSDDLQLIVHLPTNGFVHLQTPLDTILSEDTPGQYDHILNGDLEIIAPPMWSGEVESITVDFKSMSRLDLGPGRSGEVDVLFNRHVTLSNDLRLSPGSQRYVCAAIPADSRFAFSLILPCTLPVHDQHQNGRIAHRAYAELVATASRPPTKPSSPRDFFDRNNSPSHTHLSAVAVGDAHRVTYGSDSRMRIAHMTERDANFISLNTSMQGMEDGLGIYAIALVSDIVSSVRSPSKRFSELNSCNLVDHSGSVPIYDKAPLPVSALDHLLDPPLHHPNLNNPISARSPRRCTSDDDRQAGAG